MPFLKKKKRLFPFVGRDDYFTTSDKKKKLIYIQIDACTRHQRIFLEKNVQFERKEKIIKKTLGVVDTQGKHAVSDIKKTVHHKLERFKIRVKNVLSISLDNAKNMIKTVKELKTNENSAESMEDEPIMDEQYQEEIGSDD